MAELYYLRVQPQKDSHNSLCHNVLMSKPRISIIAAIGRNRELGKNNKLIWRIAADLHRVKALTTGHIIIMGRNTYESIGRPLPNRTNIVISGSITEIDGCLVFPTLIEALNHTTHAESTEVFIFGGARVYQDALPFVTRLYLTLIDDAEPKADVYFPDYSTFTKIVSSESHADHIPPYTWLTLER